MSLFEKEKDAVSLIIDIGSGSVTASFVLFSKNSPPIFLYSVKKSFVLVEKIDSGKLFEGMNTLLDDILKEIMQKGLIDKYGKGKKLKGALVTVSSPWFMLKTKHIEISSENLFSVTTDFIKGIIEKEEETFLKELGKTDEGNGDDSFVVIEKNIVHSKVNGYDVKEPIGQKTKMFDAFLCMSVVSKAVVTRINDIIFAHTHIPKEKILLHTFPLASFSVIRDTFSNNSDFILLDVTGEVTDVTLVMQDVITHSVSFPSGRNFILRQISKAFDSPLEVAESTLHLYLSKKIDEATSLKIEKVILGVEKEWAIYLENALLELSPHIALPSRLFLTADNDVAEIYKDFLSLSKTDATSSFRKNLNLYHINDETLSAMYIKEPSVKVDEFMAILALFYNKLVQD